MKNEWLKTCRENFKSGSQRKEILKKYPSYFSIDMPGWAGEDPLEGFFNNYLELLEKGKVVWGRIIQANKRLFDEGEADHPGELVYSLNDTFQEAEKLNEISVRIGSLKGTEQEDKELNHIAHYLTNEKIRVFGLDVPETISPDCNYKISTTQFFRKHLPNGVLCNRNVPIIIFPKNGFIYSAVLPSHFWPQEMIYEWCGGEATNKAVDFKEEDEQDLSSGQIRLYGLGISIVGIILLALFAGYPLYKAHNGADSIDVSRKLIFLALFVVEGGVITVALGRHILTLVKAVMPEDGYNTKLSDLPMLFWFVGVSSVALIVYAYSWYEAELEKLGFKDY